MSDLAEIKGLVEKINPVLTELRGEVDALKSSQPKDVVTEEKHQKMADEITAKMAELQAKQAKLEAAANRPDAGADDQSLEQKKAFDGFFRKGEMGSIQEGIGARIEVKAMSTDVNPDGGYLVYPQLVDQVVSRIIETSPVRAIANVIQTDSTSVEMLIDDQRAGGRWVGEGASGGETDTPQIGRKVIPVHKMEADPRQTLEMIRSAYLNVEQWLSTKVADEFSYMEASAFVSGDGVNKPRGFLTYAAQSTPGTYERNAIHQVNMGGATALTADGLIAVQNGLKEAYQPNATWGMKRATFGAALQLKGNDNYFFSPVLLRDGQTSLSLLGRPVVFMDDMPAVAANALSVVYADFSRFYTVVDGMSLTVLRDPFTNKGFITYYTTKGVGGDVTGFDAGVIGKVAA